MYCNKGAKDKNFKKILVLLNSSRRRRLVWSSINLFNKYAKIKSIRIRTITRPDLFWDWYWLLKAWDLLSIHSYSFIECKISISNENKA